MDEINKYLDNTEYKLDIKVLKNAVHKANKRETESCRMSGLMKNAEDKRKQR